MREWAIKEFAVTSEPIYAKQKKGAVWKCAVHVSPDLFHQEQDDTYQLHATTYARNTDTYTHTARANACTNHTTHIHANACTCCSDKHC